MDAILYEQPLAAIRAAWILSDNGILSMETPREIPTGVTKRVSSEAYGSYRRGRDSACVDCVLCSRLQDTTPVVLLSLRKATSYFGGMWWIYGGVLQAYQPVGDFIAGRLEAECGIDLKPEVLIGFYRTCAGDAVGSTLQPCYAAVVPIEVVRRKMTVDEDHTNVRLFTAEDLERIPEQERHWYPLRVAKLALSAMP
ncbi:MAG: hypothetical protein AAB964_02775 [Patescibacteria group bacterium]